MSLRGRKNVPVGLSIFSWAGAPAILDDTFSASENLNAGVSVPSKIHRADPKPEVVSAICGQSISFLPSAYQGARVMSTDTLRISLVLEVSSREQERE